MRGNMRHGSLLTFWRFTNRIIIIIIMHDCTNLFNMKWEKKSIWGQKSGRVSNIAYPIVPPPMPLLSRGSMLK